MIYTKCGCTMCLEDTVDDLLRVMKSFERLVDMEIEDVDTFVTFYNAVGEWWETEGRPAVERARGQL